MKNCEQVSSDVIRQNVAYNPETGNFTWLVSSSKSRGRHSGRVAENPAGSISGGRYVQVAFDRMVFAGHRLAWFMMTNQWPEKDVDHINGNKLDNRFSNLRLASRMQNCANRSKASCNKTGYKGVSVCAQTSKYRAVIQVKRKQIHLGRFKTPQMAHEAYMKAAREHFGEFARA